MEWKPKETMRLFPNDCRKIGKKGITSDIRFYRNIEVTQQKTIGHYPPQGRVILLTFSWIFFSLSTQAFASHELISHRPLQEEIQLIIDSIWLSFHRDMTKWLSVLRRNVLLLLYASCSHYRVVSRYILRIMNLNVVICWKVGATKDI